ISRGAAECAEDWLLRALRGSASPQIFAWKGEDYDPAFKFAVISVIRAVSFLTSLLWLERKPWISSRWAMPNQTPAMLASTTPYLSPSFSTRNSTVTGSGSGTPDAGTRTAVTR